MPVQAKFDQWAPKYEQDAKAWSFCTPECLSRDLQRHIPANGRILELGIGTGLLTEHFRQSHGGTHITGVDASEEMLKICAEKNVADVLVNHNVDAPAGLPFPENSFHVTAASSLFEFITDAPKLMHEMARVTNAGGIIGFGYDISTTDPVETFTFEQGTSFERTYTRFSPSYIKAELKNAGIKPVHRRRIQAYKTVNARVCVMSELIIGLNAGL